MKDIDKYTKQELFDLAQAWKKNSLDWQEEAAKWQEQANLLARKRKDKGRARVPYQLTPKGLEAISRGKSEGKEKLSCS